MSTKELTRNKPVTAPPAPRTRPLSVLQTEIDRVFNAFAHWPPALAATSFFPSMEIAETDQSINLTIELPGMDEKDVEISISGDILTIRGEKKSETEESKKTYRLIERSYGAFERSVALPSGVDTTKVTANLTKGVLRIEAPKSVSAKPQAVKINVK